MLQIRTLDEFDRDLKRLKREGKDLAELFAIIRLLQEEQPLDPAFRDHPLHGEWAGSRELHLEGDWLLAYRIEKGTLVLERTGTHADLFRSWRGR